MRQFDSKIVFGPGGLIQDDCRENEDLLEQLEKTPVLRPFALLKLAKFYGAYPTNASLADHLTLVALLKLARPHDLKKQLDENAEETALTANKSMAVPDDEVHGGSESWDDVWEDFLTGTSDEGSEGYSAATVRVQWLSVSGIGLLIETPETDNRKHHYVIGVSPDPDSL